MNFSKFNRIRIWNPLSARVINKWIFNDEALVGSDKKCRIRLKNLNGIKARLDFNQKEILNLESGKTSPLIAGQIFQIDSFVFQWSQVQLTKYINIGSIVSVSSILLFLIIIGIFRVNKDIECTSDIYQISEGVWRKNSSITSSLYERRQSFRDAMKESLFLKARGELDSIKEIIDHIESDKSCAIDKAYHGLEIEFSTQLIQSYIKNEDLHKAANELKRISDLVGEDRASKLYRRVIKETKQRYLNGYRLEDQNLDKAQELMEDAETVCQILSLNSKCFMQQTSHQKASSHEIRYPG